MSILIPVSEERNPQLLHKTPVSKLYGVPFINSIRDKISGVGSIVEMDGKNNNEVREVSDLYSAIDILAKVGYIDFMLPINVKSVSGNQRDSYPYSYSIKASSIVEAYANPNDASDSIIRVRDNEKQEDKLYTVDETLAEITALIPAAGGGSEYLSFSRSFTQAEVRTLNTLNGGYGIELLPYPGAGKIYHIVHPLLTTKLTGGAFATAEIWIYTFDYGTPVFLGSTNSNTIPPTTLVEQMNLEDASFHKLNDSIYLYSSIEQSTFEGTWELTFNYKIVDIS